MTSGVIKLFKTHSAKLKVYKSHIQLQPLHAHICWNRQATGHTARMFHLYNSCPTRSADKPDIEQPSHTVRSGVMSKARVWEWLADPGLQHCNFIMALAFFHRDTWTMRCFMEVLENLMTSPDDKEKCLCLLNNIDGPGRKLKCQLHSIFEEWSKGIGEYCRCNANHFN